MKIATSNTLSSFLVSGALASGKVNELKRDTKNDGMD